MVVEAHGFDLFGTGGRLCTCLDIDVVVVNQSAYSVVGMVAASGIAGVVVIVKQYVCDAIA